jgi:glycosyltransferase involved in cell wall biosynthesis
MKALYLSYFGLREPLVQTQVLPYLKELAADGVAVSLLTFEPALRRSFSASERQRWKETLEGDGIRWRALAYHKRPTLPATLYDIAVGAFTVVSMLLREKIDVLHARGHVPAAMALAAKRLAGGRLLFDIRGFMPEEYTDGGMWPAGGFLYRLTKAVERRLLAGSDGFVVLTERAKAILFPGCLDADRRGRPIEVIPCCVDMKRFGNGSRGSREDLRRRLGMGQRTVLAYVGSLGTWYMLDEMADFFAASRRRTGSYALVLTQSDPALMMDRLRARGLDDSDFLITRVRPDEIPQYLHASDAALSFIKPCFSKLSSSPTKIAEYLASGLPVVCNAGVGDVDDAIGGSNVGVIVSEFDAVTYDGALSRLDILRKDPSLADRCRRSAEQQFDLQKIGCERYKRLYRRLVA